MKRIHLLPLLLWTLLWGLFFATLLLGIERLPNGDLSGQFHAFGSFQAREMLAGRLPLWSSGSYGGIPFAADTQSAVFYPLRWLTILLSAPTGFSYYALELEGLLHIWLAGVFAYFLAFDLTNSQLPTVNGQRSIAIWAGLVTAVAFGLGGYLISYPLLQLALLETMAWLPLILLLIRRGVLADNKLNVRYLLAAGAVLGVSALAGHPQTFMHVSYLAAAYFLFLAWQARWRWTAVLGLGVMVAVVAVGTAMAAFLPALRFLGQTVRSDVSYEFVSKGFALLDYLQTFVPGPFSVWQSSYVGLTAVFLALFAIFAAFKNKNIQGFAKRETLFWGLIVLLAAWLSLGDKGILYALAYRILPGFALFRQQERLVAWLSIGLALLAAQGLVSWWRLNVEQRRALLRRTGWVTAVLLLIFGFMLAMMQSAVGWSWIATWLRQTGFLLLTILLLWPWTMHTFSGKRWQKAVPFLLILLLFVDLFLTARKPLDLQDEAPTVFWPQPAWLDELPRGEVARIDGQNLVHVNLGELFELEDIRGISPLKPAASARFEKLPRPLRWQLLNVAYVLAPEQIEDELTEVARIDGSLVPGEALDAYVYRFEDAQPRAWMSYEPSILPDEDAAWQQLKQPEFDPATQVILTTPMADVVMPPEETPFVVVTRDKPGALRIEVETQTPGLLVISEWMLPGWQAELDGMAVPILTANTALQAAYMPAGKHILELTYRPWEAWLGIGITLLTLFSAAVIAWRWQPEIPLRIEAKPPTRAEQGQSRRSGTEREGAVRALDEKMARWLLVGVILLGFGLRVYRLGHQELRGDEAFSYLYTLLPLDEVIPELIDEGDPHSPFHYLLLNVWTNVAGASEMAMRYLSLLPGVLLLPLVYLLGVQMAGRRVGLLAALFTALSPALIWLSQDVRNQYNLALLFSLLATWLLVHVVKQKERQYIWWALYALCAALAVYGHYFAVFALMAHGLYLWFARVNKRQWIAWLLSGVVAMGLFLPWATAVLTNLITAGQLNDPSQPELTRYLTTVGVEMLLGPGAEGWWPRWLFLGGFALCLYAAWALWRRKPAWVAFLLSWLGLATLMIFLVRFSRSTFNPFYIAVAAPAWWLLLAVGLLFLWWQGGWRRILVVAGLLVWATAVALSLRNIYFDPTYSRTRGLREAAVSIQAEAQPNDLFLSHFPDPALDYYLRDIDIPRQMQPATVAATAAETKAALADLSMEFDRLWFIPYQGSVWDRQAVVPNWLNDHMLPEQDSSAGGMTLQAWRSLESVDQFVQPNDVALVGSIDLQGVVMLVNGRSTDLTQPIHVTTGDTIDTTLLWTTVAPIAESYTAFVHLLDDNGVLLAQHDGIPHDGNLPTLLWEEGESVLDRHVLVVPESVGGNGRIVVGLYNSETLERLQFENGQDVLSIVEFEIK